jgi:glycosyltransferase involved in cell wall biosynthesis
MKLLMIFPFTIRGGAEEYALTLARSAVDQGIEVHAAFPDVAAAKSLKCDFTEHGIIYHPLANSYEPLISFALLTRGIFYILRVLGLLNKIRPDIVIIVLSWPDRCLAPILASAFKNIPTAVVFQLVPPVFPPISSFRKNIYRWARGRKQQWIAISENNRDILSRIYDVPVQEIVRIYNGSRVSTDEQLDPSEDLRAEVRRELNVPASRVILLTVGRLHPQKGYDCLMQLVPGILHDFPECTFVWAGEGELRGYLERSIREQGIKSHVLLLGHRQDINRLMRASDLFLFPSRFEGGQSFVITEAMANGLPIISTNASGIGEVIHDKIHGLLSTVDDSMGLRDNIYWALRNPSEMHTLSRNARVRVAEFSEERMIGETIQLINKLVLSGK